MLAFSQNTSVLGNARSIQMKIHFVFCPFFRRLLDTMNESLVSELILDPNHHQTSNLSALPITGPLEDGTEVLYNSSISTTAATAIKSADTDPEWVADTAWTVGFTFIVVVGTCGNAIVLWIVTGTFDYRTLHTYGQK